MNAISFLLICVAIGDPADTEIAQYAIRDSPKNLLRILRRRLDTHSLQPPSSRSNFGLIDTTDKPDVSLARFLLASSPQNAFARRARWTKSPTMSLNPDSWTLARKKDGSYELDAAEVGFIGKVVYTKIPRSAEAPSLGLGLDEIASDGKAGIVCVSSIAEGGNGAKASEPLMLGDVLVSASEVDRANSKVMLEGLTFDDAVGKISTLNPAKDVFLEVKRLTRIPRATVRVVCPDAEDQVVTLWPGIDLRRALRSKKIKVNDPAAPRFAFGSGDCGGEGTCGTCVVEVVSGMDALSAQSTQEAGMLQGQPNRRLACMSKINLKEDADLTIKVRPYSGSL